MIKCVIIDDAELARDLLRSYIDKIDFLQLLASFENPIEALDYVNSNNVDILFLDIQMNELRGIDFVKLLNKPVNVVFTTAYPEYALNGYELDALDYILKPVTFNRFLKAINKLNIATPSTDTYDKIVIKSGYELHKVALEDIMYVSSNNEYVDYHTAKRKIMSYQRLKSLEDILPSNIFIRVHRSFIVNIEHVDSMADRILRIGDVSIPIGVSYYDNVKKLLFGS